MKKNIIKCPICDLIDYNIIYKPYKFVNDPKILYGSANGIMGTQTIVKCKNCSMIYENPRFDDKIILNSYTEHEELTHDSQFELRVKSFKNALIKLNKHLKNKKTILDVGTAGGAFLKAANELGYESTGLEPSKSLCEQAKLRNLNVINGTINNINFEKKFDIITLWDVIEHLTDPKDVLIKVNSMLKDDGILIINYPDIGSVLAKIMGKRFWWIISVHLHHFNKKTIKLISEKANFRKIENLMYWQYLEFGYLIKMADHLGFPFANFIYKFIPSFLKKLPLPYYAAQTTFIAHKKI